MTPSGEWKGGANDTNNTCAGDDDADTDNNDGGIV